MSGFQEEGQTETTKPKSHKNKQTKEQTSEQELEHKGSFKCPKLSN